MLGRVLESRQIVIVEGQGDGGLKAGLAISIYLFIWCIYFRYFMYGVYMVYMVYTRYSGQGNHQLYTAIYGGVFVRSRMVHIYGHVWCIYTVIYVACIWSGPILMYKLDSKKGKGVAHMLLEYLNRDHKLCTGGLFSCCSHLWCACVSRCTQALRVRTYIHARAHTHACTHSHTLTHMHAHTCMHTHTHTHAHTHTHTHVPNLQAWAFTPGNAWWQTGRLCWVRMPSISVAAICLPAHLAKVSDANYEMRQMMQNMRCVICCVYYKDGLSENASTPM